MMKLAVLISRQDPLSFQVYRENVVQELVTLGVKVLPFGTEDPIPSRCDVSWVQSSEIRGITGILRDNEAPVVATLHGGAMFSMSIREFTRGWKESLKLSITKPLHAYYYRRFGKSVSAAIAVSKFGAQDIARAFFLPQESIHVIYHGVAHEIFKLEGGKQPTERPYWFHVSAYQPKKNVDRIFAAYAQLPEPNRPDFIAVLPGYPTTVDVKGIRLIHEGLSQAELAKWYRGALGFVFPSLHETFGMPILEAMACGCPVITSNVTACPEVAGDAALLVDPRSVNEIASAMHRLMEDASLRQSLRQKGLARAQQFTWRKSAEEHLKVFEQVSKCR